MTYNSFITGNTFETTSGSGTDSQGMDFAATTNSTININGELASNTFNITDPDSYGIVFRGADSVINVTQATDADDLSDQNAGATVNVEDPDIMSWGS